LPLGLTRWQGGGFSVLSFDPSVLARVVPHLQPAGTDDSAQIRVHVGDVSNSKLASWVKLLTHTRAKQASVGNVRLLNLLTQQLNVAREESQRTANSLLNTTLSCSLGGKYELSEKQGDLYWQSDKWSLDSAQYDAPLLQWFRGLDAGLTKLDDRLVLHTEIDMQRQAQDSGLKLPFFNLLGGRGKEAANPNGAGNKK
jgi:hypothetical protein